MFLACFAVFGTNKADILAFGSQIFIAVQQVANVELVFRRVVFKAVDLVIFIAVGAEISVAAAQATFYLNALGQALLQG